MTSTAQTGVFSIICQTHVNLCYHLIVTCDQFTGLVLGTLLCDVPIFDKLCYILALGEVS